MRLCEPVVDRGCDTTLTKFRALCFRPINVMNYIAHDHKAEVGRKYNGCLNLRLTHAHVEGRE